MSHAEPAANSSKATAQIKLRSHPPPGVAGAEVSWSMNSAGKGVDTAATAVGARSNSLTWDRGWKSPWTAWLTSDDAGTFPSRSRYWISLVVARILQDWPSVPL